MTCADLDRGLPKGAWLRVSGCTGSLLDATFKTRLGVVTEVYLPLHAKRDGETEPAAHLVLATRDQEVRLAKTMSKIDSKDIKAMLGLVAENAKRLRFEKDVEGMVRSGIDSDDKVLKHLREKKEGLAADFVVLDDGRKPGFLWSAFLLGAGVLLLLVLGGGAVLQAGSASS